MVGLRQRKIVLSILFAIITIEFVFLCYYRFPVLEVKPLEINGPSVGTVGERITLTITSNGQAVGDALVVVDNQTKRSRPNGTVMFVFYEPGRHVVMASKKGYKPANFTIDISTIPIRGLFICTDNPNFEYLIEKAKEIGANYIQIVYWVEVLVNGSILPDQYSPHGWHKEKVISQIQEVHKASLKAYLQVYPEYYGTFGAHAGELEMGPVENQTLFMREMEKVALEWAKIAEELHVELFSPACELNVFLSWENNMEWHRQILPKLRAIYHGEIVQKGELAWQKYRLFPEGDLSFYDHYAGWDYVNSDIFENVNGTKSLEDYRSYINKTVSNLLILKEKHHAKGVVLGEIGIPEGSYARGVFRESHRLSEEEYRFIFWSILFEECQGKVDGFFFWDWNRGSSVEELIKCYYRGLGKDCIKKASLKFKEEAMQAIDKAEEVLDQIKNFSSLLGEKAECSLLKAKEAFDEGDYIFAKFWAYEAYSLYSRINLLGIVIDGLGEDWVKYEPLAIDDQNDAPPGEDLTSIYVINDNEYLYFMFEFADKPKADIVLFFDVNLDETWDYHIRASKEFTFLAKTIRPDYHEFICNLEYAYGNVVEFKVPLEPVGYPNMIKIQAASWSMEAEDISDKMAGFNWLNYTIQVSG